MTKILVTGGAGFIGGNFIHFLMRETDVRILNLDLLTYAGNPETLEEFKGNPRYSMIRGDIVDAALVRQLLVEFQPDAIVNFAAESHVDRSIDGPAGFIQTNVVGTFNLLDCARDYWGNMAGERRSSFRFLHVSTDEVYGSLGAKGAFTEAHPYSPNSPYSASKAASDHLVRAWFNTYDLPVLTTNCSNNYGPYQFPEKLIPVTILNASEGKPLPIYGDGRNVRDWLHVADHCRAIWCVLANGQPGEVYNVGGDCERTNVEVVDRVCSLMDALLPESPHRPHHQLKIFVQDRPGHDHRYAIDATKIKTRLDWKPEITFEAGLEQTVRWYLTNRDWISKVLDGSYQQKRLGLATQ